jgi:hypothetical protein
LANLSGGPNAETDYFEDEFLASLPIAASGESEGLLDGVAPVDKIDGTPLLRRSLFNDDVDATTSSARGAEQDVVATLTNWANFQSNYGTRHNRFTNQNSALNLGWQCRRHVGDMSATRQNVANFRADRGNLATWIPVCIGTLLCRDFPTLTDHEQTIFGCAWY